MLGDYASEAIFRPQRSLIPI